MRSERVNCITVEMGCITIQASLTCDWGFRDPREPVHPLTDEPLDCPSVTLSTFLGPVGT